MYCRYLKYALLTSFIFLLLRNNISYCQPEYSIFNRISLGKRFLLIEDYIGNHDKSVFKWIEAQKKNTKYISLSERDDIFKVKTASSDDACNNLTILKTGILTHIWEATWFNILTFIIIIILIFLFYRLRTKQINWLNKTLEEKVKQRTLDIEQVNDDLKKQKEDIIVKNSEILEQRNSISKQNEELEKYRNQLENIVKQRTGELELAKEKAEESERLKSAFLDNMSHEIRTPMHAIMGFANLLSNTSLNELQTHYIKYIVEGSENLLNLINDLIVFSEIEAGNMVVRKEKFILSRFMAETFEYFRNIYSNSLKPGLEFRLKIPSDSYYELENDVKKIRQIFNNLISNALKYTEKGVIEMGYSLEPYRVKFYVKDSGIGIAEEQISYIFDRFRKAESIKTKIYRGIGLGLAISKKLAELLTGTIWVDSKPGEGSTFYFSLPLELKTATKISDMKLKKEESYNWHGKLFLIVEDENVNYRFLEVCLRNTNAKIIRAYDGNQAVSLYAENPNIDLILMDIKLPEMDGYEATREIRKLNTTVPIIAQTAFAMTGDREKVMEAGCNDYLSKPFISSDLLFLIDRHLPK